MERHECRGDHSGRKKAEPEGDGEGDELQERGFGLNLSELYNSNEKFRKYVDKYCALYRVTKEQAFEMMIVQMVAKQYAEEGEEDEAKGD